MNWRTQFWTLVLTAGVITTMCYVVILAADPYQNVPFSPRVARAPVDPNQRFSYPTVARDPKFDSAVIGTSTVRLLNPNHLDALFRARFANLAMNSATAWEQTRLARLFLRSRPRTRFLVLGLDVVWCAPGTHYTRYTFRMFPEWMYDDNRWNDLLYLFNDKALEQAVREIEYLRGTRAAKYRRDGYRYFLPDDNRYDVAKARIKIYGTPTVEATSQPAPPALTPTALAPALQFATHELLAELLRDTSEDTIKVLMFVPYHVQLQRAGARDYAECKGRITDLAARYANTHVVDFMIPSAITTEDRNYWDPLHYTRDVARTLERLLPVAVAQQRDEPGYLVYLTADRVDRSIGAQTQ